MKKLFLMVSALLTSSVMFAQWTKPTPKTSPVATDGSVHYLYNVEAEGFMIGANDWNTRVSISQDKGYKVRITEAIDPETNEPNGCYMIEDSVETKSNWYKMWGTSYDVVYTDYGSQGIQYYNTWNIIKGEGNNFELTLQALIDEFGCGKLGYSEIVDGSKANTRTWFWMDDVTYTNVEGEELPRFEGKFMTTWALVSPEDYNVWFEANKVYAAAQALKAEIDQVPEGFDVSTWNAVYNNTASTQEELEAALADLKNAELEYVAGQATVDNPKDMTGAIVNPNFDGIKFDGWKGSSFGAGGATDECGERYSMNYDTYQVIENIPNGIYRVNVNAFYRAGSIDNDWNTQDDPSKRYAKLYAASGADSLAVGIRSLSSVSTERTDLGGAAIGPDGRYAPNSMQDFVRYENAGIDMDNSLMIPVMDGKLKIGVTKNQLLDTDWTITDTWRLTFYGGDIAAYRMWSEDVLKAIAGDLQDYITEDTYYCRAEIANFQEALKAAREATTVEDIHANTIAMTEVTQRALASIDAYRDYATLVAQYCDGINDGTYDYNGSLWEDFCDYVQAEEENTLAPGELTGEEIAAKGVELQKMFEDAVKASITEGSDCTNMLVNPNFTDADGKGWTWVKNDNVTALNKRGGNAEFFCAEAYGGWDSNAGFLFDVYQEVTDVPDGIYQISANCFYRWADNGQFTGEEPVPAVIYMNDFQSPVQHIASNAVAAEDIMEDDGTTLKEGWYGSWVNTDGIGYVPNSMDAASNAFKKDMYKQTVYGLVEGGKMRIGIKKEVPTAENRHWCLWTNFKLTYAGKSAEAVSSVIESLLPNIEAYLDANKDGNITDPAALALEDAIDAANDAVNGSDGEEMYQAMIDLNAAYAAAQANAALVSQVQGIYDALASNTGDKVAEMDDDKLNDQYEKFFGVIDAEEHLELTSEALSQFLEDAKAFIAQVDDAYVAWQQETKYAEVAEIVADASDDAPAELTDYLVNPDLSTGNAEGWNLDIVTATNKGYQANSVYTGAENEEGYTPTCNQFIEVWRSGNSPILGDINQKIMLPAGTYKLTADIIASYQGDASAEVVGCYLYAGEARMQVGTGNGTPEHFELIFKVDEDKTLVQLGINCSETTNANWLAADNFTLTAYGKNSQIGTNGEENAIEGVIANRDEKAIYSLTGVRMNKISRTGLYIVNGKKVLVK